MDCQLSFDCFKVIEVRPLSPEEDNTVKKLESTNVELQGFPQSGIEVVSSSSFTRQQPATIRKNGSSEETCFIESSPRLPIPERQISLSWPPSPNANISLTSVPSSDNPYFHSYLLNHQDQEASGLNDKLPFLLRIHSGHFHICLGLCSQTVLWKTLEGDSSSSIHFPFRFPTYFAFGLWLFALISFLLISGAYLLKCFFHFDIVRKEYYDRVRANYFFVPWIAGILLRLGIPSRIAPDNVHPILWCLFMVPITALELKIYGQWFTKGRRSLSRIANPSTHLSVIGNFMVARLATRVEWRETAMFFFTVGLVHYVVVFVTLYQRLSPDIAVSRQICPVYFLFIAAPSSASVAWEAMSGSFDTVSRMLLFLSLFLYSALVVRVKFFTDALRRFSVVWWACAYPVTTVSVAAIKYAKKVGHPVATTLAFVLCSASMGTVLLLAVLTAVNMVVASDRVFPDDRVLIICSTEFKKTSPKARRRPIYHYRRPRTSFCRRVRYGL